MDVKLLSIMTPDPVCVHEDSHLKECLTLMNRHNVSHLIVIDKQRKAKGVIAKTDVLKHLLQLTMKTTGKTYTALEMHNIPVSEVMSKQPITFDENQSIEEIIPVMVKNKISSIPITRDEKLIGIVTSFDILSHLSKLKS